MNRKEHWQNIYQDKPSIEVSWYQQKPKTSLDWICNKNLQLDEAIIDIGGGASVLIDFLLQYGFQNLSVLDISQNALLSSQVRLGLDTKKVTWIETDITQYDSLQQYKLWHDRAVFHFLVDANDRKEYIKRLQKNLVKGGYLIIAAFAVGGPTKCSGLDIVQYDVDKISTELGDHFHLLEHKKETHLTPSNSKQQFNYFYFQKIS